MKKLFTLMILLVFTLTIVEAQKSVVTLKTFSYALGYQDSNNKMVWGESSETSLLIIIDIDEDIITIDNKQDSKFYIRTSEGSKAGRDSDGDTYSQYYFNCFDEEGIKCTLVIKSWDDYNLHIIYIFYTDMGVVYSCKKI